MKRKWFLRTLLGLCVCLMSAICCVACNKDGETKTGEITFTTLAVDGMEVYGEVSNATETFSFSDEILAKGGANYAIAFDAQGAQMAETETVPLAIGDNKIYVFEIFNEKTTKVYTVTLRRRPTYTVDFETGFAETIDTQTIEEGAFAMKPAALEREGYRFNGWDYDFSQPILQNQTIAARWVANEHTSYKVEYYLQNLENDGYTLQKTDVLTGKTDTTAVASVIGYENYTFVLEDSTLRGNINGDGSLVLRVHYKRKTFKIKAQTNIYGENVGTLTKSGMYKYGKEITSTATPYPGYSFVGWYSGGELISTDATHTFTVESDIFARFEANPEMAPFRFETTHNTCKILALNDKTVSRVVIPDCVTSIGSSAFIDCKNLTEIIISDSVKSMGTSVFYGCESLINVEMGKGLKNVGAYAFSDCNNLKRIVVGESVTDIENRAFYNCGGLEEIVIFNRVTTIGVWAFYGCENLKEIVIPNTVHSIGEGAFMECNNLKTISIPFLGETKDDKENAFLGYIFGAIVPSLNGDYVSKSLQKVTLTNVTVVDRLAFSYCSNITEVALCDGVTSIDDSAFSDCIMLESVIIPESVTSIGAAVFYGCGALKKVVIPSEVTRINNYTFYGCRALEEVILPNTLESIGKQAFYNCEKLSKILIPIGVTNMDTKSFDTCENLSIYCEAAGRPDGWPLLWAWKVPFTYWYSEEEPVLNQDGTAYDGLHWRYVDGEVVVWDYVPRE